MKHRSDQVESGLKEEIRVLRHELGQLKSKHGLLNCHKLMMLYEKDETLVTDLDRQAVEFASVIEQVDSQLTERDREIAQLRAKMEELIGTNKDFYDQVVELRKLVDQKDFELKQNKETIEKQQGIIYDLEKMVIEDEK
jgi:uncharacterized coiled-coil protein SlyX